VDLILPIIRPADNGIEVAKDRASRDSGSAAHAEDRLANSSSTLESHSAIHRFEAADCTATGPEVAFGVLEYDPPILESTAVVSTVQSIINIQYDIAAPESLRLPADINVEGLNEDPSTVRYPCAYSIPIRDIQPDRKRGGISTNDSKATKFSTRPTKSGSGRDVSRDRRQTTDRNAVGSTRRVSLGDSAGNRKWLSDKTALQKSRILTEVNRKFRGGTGNSTDGRNLMTSSVTAVVAPRSCSTANVRPSASLGAQQLTTSSKPKPEMRLRLAATQSRVGSLRLSFVCLI